MPHFRIKAIDPKFETLKENVLPEIMMLNRKAAFNWRHLLIGTIVLVALVQFILWNRSGDDEKKSKPMNVEDRLFQTMMALSSNIERLTKLERDIYLKNFFLGSIPIQSDLAANKPANSEDDIDVRLKTLMNPDKNLVCPTCVRIDQSIRRAPRAIYIQSKSTHYIGERYSKWPVSSCDIQCFVKMEAEPEIDPNVLPIDAYIWGSGYLEIARTKRLTNTSLNIFHHLESNTKHPEYMNHYAEVGKMYDITHSYHLESDPIIQDLKDAKRDFIHLTGSYSPFDKVANFYNLGIEDIIWENFEKSAPISMFITNCIGLMKARNEFLAEIFDKLNLGHKVHSFGKCRRNRQVDDILCPKGAWMYEQKICTMKKYKFYFAFDSIPEEGYVSEKYFHALLAGSVPIYFGANNIELYDPMYGREGPRSIIKASDFKSTTELFEHIDFLSNNEEEYMKYHHWRKLPPTDHWTHLVNVAYDSPQSLCLLCKAVVEFKTSHNIPFQTAG